jgi:hypothetical protein
MCDEDAWRNHALSLESELESLKQKQDLEDEEGMFESPNLIPSTSLTVIRRTRSSAAKRDQGHVRRLGSRSSKEETEEGW